MKKSVFNRAVKARAKEARPKGKYAKVTPEYEEFLRTADRTTLTPAQKGLQTRILKYGSIVDSYNFTERGRTGLVMGGKYAGSIKRKKGTAKMSRKKHKAMSSKGGLSAARKRNQERATKEATQPKTEEVVVDFEAGTFN